MLNPFEAFFSFAKVDGKNSLAELLQVFNEVHMEINLTHSGYSKQVCSSLPVNGCDLGNSNDSYLAQSEIALWEI